MPHELTMPSATPASTNGHAPPAESPLDRARRIRGGDIRPDDYLPVPDELRARIENELRFAQGLHPHAVLGDIERTRVWQDRVLMHHHDGAVVAVLRNEGGVIVMGIGLDEIGGLSRQARAKEWAKQVVIEFPFSGSYLL